MLTPHGLEAIRAISDSPSILWPPEDRELGPYWDIVTLGTLEEAGGIVSYIVPVDDWKSKTGAKGLGYDEKIDLEESGDPVQYLIDWMNYNVGVQENFEKAGGWYIIEFESTANPFNPQATPRTQRYRLLIEIEPIAGHPMAVSIKRAIDVKYETDLITPWNQGRIDQGFMKITDPVVRKSQFGWFGPIDMEALNKTFDSINFSTIPLG
jgi:hypothetical protein